jgi:ubiquinone/menaquinone biosynthesis C-methylase UbiE
MDVVDLCSGDCWFTLPIARIARHVTAIDIDTKLLDLCRAKCAAQGVTNSDFVAGDAYDVAKLMPQRADFVLLANAFHGVPDRPRLVKAVADVLKPGGMFAIVNWHQRPREETIVLGEPRGPSTKLRMNPEEVIAVVTSARFALKRVVQFPPYHYGAVFLRISA